MANFILAWSPILLNNWQLRKVSCCLQSAHALLKWLRLSNGSAPRAATVKTSLSRLKIKISQKFLTVWPFIRINFWSRLVRPLRDKTGKKIRWALLGWSGFLFFWNFGALRGCVILTEIFALNKGFQILSIWHLDLKSLVIRYFERKVRHF